MFLDEIDKVCARADARGADVSREGVQRDLLPLIEGTTVSTKHGPVKTDHILFIASGAFHVAKPSDLLPELQGRLPIRVELSPLKEEDFRRILLILMRMVNLKSCFTDMILRLETEQGKQLALNRERIAGLYSCKGARLVL